MRVGSPSGLSTSTTTNISDLAKTYGFNRKIDESATVIYLLKSAAGGAWLIQKFDSTSKIMGYATVKNNPTVTTYAAAETNYLTLTYGRKDQAF